MLYFTAGDPMEYLPTLCLAPIGVVVVLSVAYWSLCLRTMAARWVQKSAVIRQWSTGPQF